MQSSNTCFGLSVFLEAPENVQVKNNSPAKGSNSLRHCQGVEWIHKSKERPRIIAKKLVINYAI